MIFRAIFLITGLLWHAVTLAEADGPDAWQVYGINKDSVLNVRKGPATEFAVIGKLSASAENLENLGCFPEFSSVEWERFNQHERQLAVNMRWCKIRSEDLIGWVYGKYLEEY